MEATRHPRFSKQVFLWSTLFVVVPLIYSGKIYEGALLLKLLVLQILMTGLLILRFATARNNVPAFPQSPLLIPLGAYLLFLALSVFQALNRVESVLQLAHYFSLALVPLIVMGTLSKNQLISIFRVAAWTGLPVSLIGLAQYFGKDVTILGWQLSHIPSNANPSATFFHRNAAAGYLLGVIPMAWICFRLSPTPSKTAAYAGLLALMGTYLVYTRTRGAWVGFIVAVLITVVLAYITRPSAPHPPPGLKQKLLAGALIIVFLMALLPENMLKTGYQRFDEKKSNSITTLASIVTPQGDRGRLNLWHHTLNIIQDHPLGIGLGNWQYQFPAYARGDQINVKAAPIRPHNDYLWIASETGLAGLFAYLVLLFGLAQMVWRRLPVLDSQSRTLALGMCVLILAHLTDGLFNFPRERIASALCFWFALGGLALLDRPSRSSQNRWHPLVAMPLTAVLLICSLGISLRRYAYDRHHLRVHIAEREQDWPTVINEAQNAIRHGPLRPNTFIALGRAQTRTGDLNGAREAYETAIRLHPHSLNAHNNLGIVYRRTGLLERAEQAFQTALYLFPHFPEAFYNLGNVYRNMGKWDRAIEAYENARRIGLENPALFFNLGRVYYQQGNPLRAQENYLQALQKDPQYQPAQQALTQLRISAQSLSPEAPDGP